MLSDGNSCSGNCRRADCSPYCRSWARARVFPAMVLRCQLDELQYKVPCNRTSCPVRVHGQRQELPPFLVAHFLVSGDFAHVSGIEEGSIFWKPGGGRTTWRYNCAVDSQWFVFPGSNKNVCRSEFGVVGEALFRQCGHTNGIDQIDDGVAQHVMAAGDVARSVACHCVYSQFISVSTTCGAVVIGCSKRNTQHPLQAMAEF